jgi:hypothetical protein
MSIGEGYDSLVLKKSDFLALEKLVSFLPKIQNRQTDVARSTVV